MTENSKELDWAETGLPGRFVARARRMADLSQRELAAAVGVSHGTIARIEAGKGHTSPTVLSAILRVAGLRLVVVDESGREVGPVPADAVRDNAGRRFPAHLDVAPPDREPRERRESPRYDRLEARAWYHRREERDRQRNVSPVLAEEDHPTVPDLARRRRLIRGPQPRVTAPPTPLIECTCPDGCYLEAACLTGCPCQCEPAHGGDDRRAG
ncbi:helix-turn-helix domain-containing protein [Intrasporangium oryzae]|uniref:helix-turn-helix domain-containing protein n=1 Tax=Intrasporangium oryzae TaxID=412687 RepID=UPI000687D3F8|nr:helix-turn-helix domain-containing protein [Intrasporangium oryzae]